MRLLFSIICLLSFTLVSANTAPKECCSDMKVKKHLEHDCEHQSSSKDDHQCQQDCCQFTVPLITRSEFVVFINQIDTELIVLMPQKLKTFYSELFRPPIS